MTLPPGYRAWQAVSVAHEGPPLNDIRLILANPVAMMAFRSGARPFSDGSIIARLAYRHEASARNDAVFGREQSFVAGEPTNVQIEIKDSRRFRSTGGWGYAQFERGRADPSESVIATCSACHRKLPDATDLIFTAYAP